MKEKEMLEKKVWAVIGANSSREKFGNRIYRKLKEKGYTVYPISPNFETIEGDKCYINLTSLPETPDVIDMVISPKTGLAVIEEAAGLGIKNVWLQPGTSDKALLKMIEEKEMNAVQACVLIALR